MLSDVGFLPIFPVSRRFSGQRRRRRTWYGSRMWWSKSGMDRPSDSSQETQTIHQIPDLRAGEGVPLQRLRLKAKTMGVGAELESHRATSKDLVPKSADEEQEEQPATVATTKQ